MSAFASSNFYWADWENEPTLKLCSFGAQGVWMRMCAAMHRSPRRGILLKENGRPPKISDLASWFGKPAEEVAPLVEELIDQCVCDVEEGTGALVNRRMAYKEPARAAKAKENGRKGGNPVLLQQRQVNDAALRDAVRRDQDAARQRRARAAKKAPKSPPNGGGEICFDLENSHALSRTETETSHVTPRDGHVTPSVTVNEETPSPSSVSHDVTQVKRQDKPLLPLSSIFDNPLTESSTPPRSAPPPEIGGASRVELKPDAKAAAAKARRDEAMAALASKPPARIELTPETVDDTNVVPIAGRR